MKSFRNHLDEQLKDPKFKRRYYAEKSYIELVVKLAKERIKLGISQEELAQKAHVTQQQLSKIENGINCNVHTLVKVCVALGLKLNITHDGSITK